MSTKVKSLSEAIQVFNEKMQSLGELPWGTTEVGDLGIEGTETVKYIEEIANDIHSDLQSERAESRRQAYQNEYEQDFE